MMQKLYDRTKRKYDGSSSSSERNKKHPKHSDTHKEESRMSKSMERTRVHPRPSVSSSISPAQSRKVANLLKALDEVLEVDGMDQTLELIGDEALTRCLDLQKSLSPARSKIDEEVRTSSSTLREQRSHDFFNIPQTLSPKAVTPWKASTIPLTLPPPPKILDPTLELAAFVHQGCTTGNPHDLSYERLEWVGDIYIELIATLLISQTFPLELPGKCSQHREMLVKNITLAEFSRQYGFDKRLRLPDPKVFSVTQQEMTKIHGDVFEAYVAAVILSNPTEGLSQATQWLKDIFGMVLAKDILAEERKNRGVTSPMWNLQGDRPVQGIKSKEAKPVNAKELLTRTLGYPSINLTYEETSPPRKDPNTKLAIFTQGVYLTGYGEKHKLLGTGEGTSKKEASAKAAEMALQNQKLIRVYADMRKMLTAQKEQEREAATAQQGS